MHITSFRDRAESAYTRAQDRLILFRQAVANAIANTDANTSHQQLIAAGRSNLLVTESNVAHLYALKQIAVKAPPGVVSTAWEKRFLQIADTVVEHTSTSLNNFEKSLRTEATSKIADDIVGLLNQILDDYEHYQNNNPNDSRLKQDALAEWLESFRAHYAKQTQNWTDRLQTAQNAKNEDIVRMAQSRRQDYQNILNVLNSRQSILPDK